MTKTPIEPKDIRKGYLIRVEYGDVNREGKAAVEYYAACDGFYVGGTKDSSFLIDRPKPPVVLPTEPGAYVTNYQFPDVFKLDVLTLDEVGQWRRGNAIVTIEHVERCGGNSLTKLEPVAETARKMRDAIIKTFDAEGNYYSTVREVAAEFGATP